MAIPLPESGPYVDRLHADDQRRFQALATLADYSMLVELCDTLCDWEEAAVTLWTLRRRIPGLVSPRSLPIRPKRTLIQVTT
jgi:hypothetical protein